MKSGSEDLLKGLIKISKAVLGIVVLLLVGTGMVIYLLLADRPTDSVAQAPPGAEAVETKVVPATAVADAPKIVDGKDVLTGLLAGEGLLEVKANCLSCHSAKLITQNRFTRAGWHAKIVWMQETQGLWDLGENEPFILDYLAEHYASEARASRRQPLTNIEWYELK
jgi:hypothetical protein